MLKTIAARIDPEINIIFDREWKLNSSLTWRSQWESNNSVPSSELTITYDNHENYTECETWIKVSSPAFRDSVKIYCCFNTANFVDTLLLLLILLSVNYCASWFNISSRFDNCEDYSGAICPQDQFAVIYCWVNILWKENLKTTITGHW